MALSSSNESIYRDTLVRPVYADRLLQLGFSGHPYADGLRPVPMGVRLWDHVLGVGAQF